MVSSHHPMGGLLAAAAMAAGLALAGSGPAANSTPSQLVLSITDHHGGATRSVTLQCEPPGGDHPQAQRACTDLIEARGDFGSLTGDGESRVCPLIYDPVVASAEGRLLGKGVRYTKEFANSCLMRGQTGPVFDF